MEIFNDWLAKKLQVYQIEDEALLSYISSIVTGDDPESEKSESLGDMLSEIIVGGDISLICKEILDQWSSSHTNMESDKEKRDIADYDIGQKVALIIEHQAQSQHKHANRSEEEEQLREAILTRCTFVSSDEEEYEPEEASSSKLSQTIAQNQNVETVIQAEKDKREKMKSSSEQKKAQDKLNREKQKQKQEERWEKERKRTQKQEKRR